MCPSESLVTADLNPNVVIKLMRQLRAAQTIIQKRQPKQQQGQEQVNLRAEKGKDPQQSDLRCYDVGKMLFGTNKSEW